MIGRLGDGYNHTTTIIKDRFLGFLIWQSVHSTLVYFFCKTLISPLAPSTTLLAAVLAFLFFQLALLLFSTSLFLVSSPQSVRGVSPIELFLGLLKLIFVYGGQPLPPDFRRRARVTLSFALFLASSGASAFLSVVCLSGSQVFGALGLRGLAVGLIYGSHYVFARRWVLDFPIVQRPLFFSYKMGVRKAVIKAIKLSTTGYLLSLVLPIFINDHKGQLATGDLIIEQVVFYFACVVVILCWELNRHLLQVFLTKRYMFAPPKGSAAAATNPSDHLLAALEETTPGSLVRYLAYLDLCMVTESNVDTWRRAAFFEETGETYRKVIGVCLKPLEQLTLDLSEGLGMGSSPFQVSHQLRSSTDLSSKLHEPFYDFQVYAWCARIASSLTVRSHKEDRFGVAQLSGSNAATISTLLSCLLAVETLMGKKTNLQSSNQYLTGPANIKWAALTPTRREAMTTTTTSTSSKKDTPHYSKAYSMADVLKTSIYQIVSSFYEEMVTSAKAGLLEKDWIAPGKPLYGTRELLLQKLKMFLGFQAN